MVSISIDRLKTCPSDANHASLKDSSQAIHLFVPFDVGVAKFSLGKTNKPHGQAFMPYNQDIYHEASQHSDTRLVSAF